MDFYDPPIAEINAALSTVGIDDVLALDAFSHIDHDLVVTVLDEFARFAADVVAPTDRVGDVEGVRFDASSGAVTTPAVFRDAYRLYVDAGWPSLTGSSAFGGGDFPALVGAALGEIMTSANLALSLGPALTHGAVELLTEWGTPEQRARLLPPLVAGVWTGTMNLTEPQAGSDLSGIRTVAVRRDDGTWELTGTKIFVTWGEHDLAENVVHMVLARTADGDGTRGTSLFAVPKFLVGADGSLGARNRVTCLSIEHKLGIHGSPTCVLHYDGATGELVGPLHKGLAAMFTMMNSARLAIGLQGLAVSERARQQSIAFAEERLQGRATDEAPGTQSPIIAHPDVRRMLLTVTTSIDAQRLLLYATAAARDLSGHGDPGSGEPPSRARVDLLTPIAKAWCTDEGVRNASLALQVHGGMGYVEETGVAQRWRDSRIAPIYEGTNGIQAIDLVLRKVRRDSGRAMRDLIDEMTAWLGTLESSSELADVRLALAEGCELLTKATDAIVSGSEVDALAGAVAYLELAALVVSGWLLSRHAAGTEDAAVAQRRVAHANFFAAARLSDVGALARRATAGAKYLETL